MVIAYNTLKVKDPPKSWKDLLTGNYGETGFPTPLRSGAALASVETIVEKYGWEYFEEYKAIGGKQIQSNSGVRDLVVTGELSTGVLLDYMVRPLMAKGLPSISMASDGAVFFLAHSILKEHKIPQSCRMFVNYILPRQGRKRLSR